MNLYEQLMVAGATDAPCLHTDDGFVVPYEDVEAVTAQAGNALRRRGVGPGDRVLVQVEKSSAALWLYLATLRAGAVFLPLNPAYTMAEAGYFVGDAEPALIVCAPACADAFLAIASGAAVETLDENGHGSWPDLVIQQPEDFVTVARDDDDLAAIVYTSGTTGRSKGAMLSHRNLASNARTLVEAWRFGPNDVLIHALPIFHVHGLFVATNVTMMAGGSMIFLPKFDPSEVVRSMGRATVMMGVPTYYTRLLDNPGLTREAASHMRLFVSGSAPLLVETHRAFAERTGHAILERYGMTETGMNTSNPYAGVRVPGTVGPPLPGVELRVTDPDSGRVLPDGEIGLLEVRGPNVFRGYWRRPEKTAAEFRADGFFITGDLGVIDAAGYVSIVGRGKDLIISGGLNVYPREVEAVIDALAGVVESAVVGAPHPDFGEAVTAFVVCEPGGPDEAAILGGLSAELARFKQPKRCFVIDALPRNTMGKVRKAELRDRVKGLFEPA